MLQLQEQNGGFQRGTKGEARVKEITCMVADEN